MHPPVMAKIQQAVNDIHPYYPVNILLSGGTFVANEWGVLTLVGAFGVGCAAILGSTLAVVKKVNPRLKRSDQLLVLWFVLCK